MSRICVFGASTTWGKFDTKKGGWVEILKTHLLKRNEFIQVFNLGISGNNTTSLLKRFENEIKARLKLEYKDINMIIISIGSNDTKLVNGKDLITSEKEFHNNLQKLVYISKNYVDKIVFTGLTPADESKTNPVHWNKTAFYKNKYIKKYNDIIQGFTREKNIHFVELFNEWLKIDYKKLLHDGLHPNSKGHELIFENVLEVLEKEKLI